MFSDKIRGLFFFSGIMVSLVGIFILTDRTISSLGLLLLCLGNFYIFGKKENYFSDENNFYELIHDIKTPATAQMRMAELLAKGSFGTLNEVQKDLIIQKVLSFQLMQLGGYVRQLPVQ